MSRVLTPTRVAILLCLLLSLLSTGPGTALSKPDYAPDATSSALPLLRMDPTLSIIPVGEKVCADVRVDTVEDLFGFGTVILFDPAKVQVTKVLPGPFLQPEQLDNWHVIATADNTAGRVHIGITRMVGQSPVSGSGVLATICFRGTIRGNTGLTFAESDTLMLDPYISPLPFNAKSGGAIVGPVQRHHIPLIARGF